MKSLTLKQLEKDKQDIEQKLVQAQDQLNIWQTNIIRLQGILAYINNNIKNLKGGDK